MTTANTIPITTVRLIGGVPYMPNGKIDWGEVAILLAIRARSMQRPPPTAAQRRARYKELLADNRNAERINEESA